MNRIFRVGDCVRLPDRRIGRVRGKSGGKYRVRVLRKTSKTHQFVMLPAAKLISVPCPSGWMSPAGYRRYLKPTLEKLRKRLRERKGQAQEVKP
jgi:hypothetical protein